MISANTLFRFEKLIIFVVLVLVALGVRAYSVTPQSIFPAITISRITVTVDAGDLPPDQVDTIIGRPLESALQNLPQVVHLVTNASQGSAEFTVDFVEGSDPRSDLQYVDQSIAQTRALVPQALKITTAIVNPSNEPVLSYAFTSPTVSPAALQQLLQTNIVPRFLGLPGLSRVLLVGGSLPEYHVVLDPYKLRATGLTVGNVTAAIGAENLVQGVGATESFFERSSVLLDSSVHTIADLEKLRIPTKSSSVIPLATLATIRTGTSPKVVAASYNARQAILLNVFTLQGADSVRVASLFEQRMSQLRKSLPTDVHVDKFWDQTTLIDASQRALMDALLLGALLAIFIIFIFLRNARFTLIAALVIPISIAITLLVLTYAGETLNLMSIGGLAIAVGLIIDDAIVVIENIARHRMESHSDSMSVTVDKAMRQIARAMTSSTLTTVVVFVPLALLTGISGFFFRALAFTLSISLLVSLGLALWFTPILARHLLRDNTHLENKPDIISKVIDKYELLLRWSLKYRVIILTGALLSLVGTASVLISLPSDFLPTLDEGQFEIAYAMPTGTTLQASDEAATRMEKAILRDPAVASVGRMSGIDSNGYSPTKVNQGLLRVRLVDPTHRDAYPVVNERLHKALAQSVPAALYDFHQILEDMINDLSGTSAPIAILVQGADQKTLIRIATSVADGLGKIRGVVDSSTGISYNNPQLQLTPNTTVLSAAGMTIADLGDQATARTQGIVAANLTVNSINVPVRVTIGDATPLTTALSGFASFTAVRLGTDIRTENGQHALLITANLQGASLSEVHTAITQLLSRTPMPPGYFSQVQGQIQTQQKSFNEFISVIGLAICLVYAVMLGTFHSLRQPLIILMTVPLALLGVACALRFTATPFNISSFMGVLLLVGIVVKNGILLIDVTNTERAAGHTIEDALLTAGRTRLRPIVMTTLAAIGGLIPLAFGLGQGAELERPLAIAVIGGLSTATVFTLIIIPILYASITPTTQQATDCPG